MEKALIAIADRQDNSIIVTGTNGVLDDIRNAGSSALDDHMNLKNLMDRMNIVRVGLYVFEGRLDFSIEDDEPEWIGDIRKATMDDLKEFGVI